MQIIWNNQNEEKLFAIDEQAVHDYIRRKGGRATHWLNSIEWMMIAVNLIVCVILVVDTMLENGPAYQWIIAAMYLGYVGVGIVRRRRRRQEEVHFAPTMLGDLDKAIWQYDYLIRQGNSLALWYLLPLSGVFAIFQFIEGDWWWGVGMLLLFVVAYLGARWENRKWHQSKKEGLESLRASLLQAEQAADAA